ncbi:helix-turn-helix transcriptional regulator [Rhodoferax sp.]|uniref:helix-turn-helix transcriptional regulator n=1 Tax=Rhodoferax sp. TaxID=50421 RepID=UPI0025DBC3AE|nr:helix-turn-helix transcriptional regulator [Rhodoferax sp.]
MKTSAPKSSRGANSSTSPLPNPVTLALGQNLKRHREAANKTQVDLAYDAEVERSRISKMETGRINPSLLTLATLCYSLGITLPTLFEGITATMKPVAEGGDKRRANQATLDKPAQKLARRAAKAAVSSNSVNSSRRT